MKGWIDGEAYMKGWIDGEAYMKGWIDGEAYMEGWMDRDAYMKGWIAPRSIPASCIHHYVSLYLFLLCSVLFLEFFYLNESKTLFSEENGLNSNYYFKENTAKEGLKSCYFNVVVDDKVGTSVTKLSHVARASELSLLVIS